MRFPLIVCILLGANVATSAQVAPSANDQHKLVGRWMFVSTDMPGFSGPYDDDVVIEGNTISTKLNCNRIKLVYSANEGELIATPFTSTLRQCDLRDLHTFYSFSRAVYVTLQHAKYQVDDHILRLTRFAEPFDDPKFSWSMEFRRVD